MKWMIRTCLAAACLVVAVAQAESPDSEGWKTIFDGKTLESWSINENPDSWKVEDGAIVAQGAPKSHLFYTGEKSPFRNFELMVDVQTQPNANGGIYFHTKEQKNDWPKYGYEVQVNNTHKDPIKTGSLYKVVNVTEAPAKDGEWFHMHVTVKAPRIIVKVDDKTVVDFTEEPDRKPGEDFTRKLDEGTFCLQAHDPNSVVRFKNIKVKRLD